MLKYASLYRNRLVPFSHSFLTRLYQSRTSRAAIQEKPTRQDARRKAQIDESP